MLTCWIARLRREGFSDAQIEDKISSVSAYSRKPLIHLRRFSNYLTPRIGALSLDSLTGALIYARNMIINFIIFLPFYISIILFIIAILLFVEQKHAIYTYSIFLTLGITAALLIYSHILSKSPIVESQYSINNQDGDDKRHGENVFVYFRRYSFVYFAATLLLTIAAYIFFKGSPDLAFGLRQCFAPAAGGATQVNAELLKRLFGCFPLQVIFISIVLVVLAALTVFAERYRRIAFLRVPQSDVQSTGVLTYAWPYAVEALCIAVLIILLVSYQNAIITNMSWLFVALGPLIITGLHVLGQIGYFTVTSKRRHYDIQREWLSRFIAAQMQLSVVWLVLASSVIFAESCLMKHKCGIPLEGISNGLAGLAVYSGVVSAIIAFISDRTRDDIRERRSVTAILMGGLRAIVVPAVLLAGFMLLTALLSSGVDKLLPTAGSGTQLALAIVCALVGVFLSLLVDVNRFSAHDIYRNRLVRAFLGGLNEHRNPDPFTGFDPKDDLKISDLLFEDKRGPLLIVNMTLNAAASTELAWQERRALPFTVSPVAMGSCMLRIPDKATRHKTNPAGCYRLTAAYGSRRPANL